MAEQIDILEKLEDHEEEIKLLRARVEEKEQIISDYFSKMKVLEQEFGFDRLRLEGEITQQQRKICAQASALRQISEDNQILKADLKIAQAELSFSRDREILKLKSELGRYKELLSMHFVADSVEELENEIRSLIAEREELVLQNDQLSCRLAVLEQCSSQVKACSIERGPELANNLPNAPHTVEQAGSHLANHAGSSATSRFSCKDSDNIVHNLKEEVAKILKNNEELKLALAAEERLVLELLSYKKQLEMVREELKSISTLMSLEGENIVDLARRLIGVVKEQSTQNNQQVKQIDFLSRQNELTQDLLVAARRDLSLRSVQDTVKRRKREVMKRECEDIVKQILREKAT